MENVITQPTTIVPDAVAKSKGGKKTALILLGTAVVGALVYLFIFRKKDEEIVEETPPPPPPPPTVITNPAATTSTPKTTPKTITSAPSVFPLKYGKTNDKLKPLQLALGLTGTGYWGDQTKAALSKYGVTQLNSDAEITNLINKVKSTITTQQVNQSRLNRANSLSALWKGGTYANWYFLNGSKWEHYIYDAVNKNWVKGGKNKDGKTEIGFNKDQKLNTKDYALKHIMSNGLMIIQATKGDNTGTYVASPFDLTLI